MSFEDSSDMDKLQKLVKSSLLEINKLKMEIVQLKEEQNSLKSNDEFETLKNESDELIRQKDDEISQLKRRHEVEVSDLKNKHVTEVSDLKLKYNDDLRVKDDEISSLKSSDITLL